MARTRETEETAEPGSNGRKLSSLDRMVQQAVGDERPLGRPDDPARAKFPQLWEWLTRVFIGRDRIKTPALVTVRLGPEGVLVTLTDRDLACSFDVSTAHLADVFQALEDAIAGPNPPIRTWGRKEPQLRKRRSGN